MAVFDLALGGVKVELADSVFDWLAAPVSGSQRGGSQVAKVAAEVRPAERVVERSAGVEVDAAPVVQRVFEPLTAQSAPSSSLVKPEAKRVVIPAVEIAGEVWTHGEAGGVVLLVQGGEPSEQAQKLALAMLAAAGLQQSAVAWVGYTHSVKAPQLLDAVKGFKPEQVLVLGQGPLGVLLGRNLGVEGWHAARGQAITGWDGELAGVVPGVTYPLELLLKQPLFKRLAWQHLLAWGETSTTI